jgi:hypothetical protein
MAKIGKALDCVKRLKEAIGKLPDDKEFPRNPRFISEVENVAMELDGVEEKIKNLKVPSHTEIRWNCEVPIRIIAIIGMLIRSTEKCSSAELQDFIKKIKEIQSDVSQLAGE